MVQSHFESWVLKDLLLAGLLTAISTHADVMVNRSLPVLDQILTQSAWLVGSRFTVADLNVAGVLSPSRSSQLDLSKQTNAC